MKHKETHVLTQWGRVTHICVGKLTIIGSDNGLSPGRRQAIIKTNAGILLIGTLGTNFMDILSEIHTFSFKKMHLKMSSGSWRLFCLGLNVLTAAWKIAANVWFVVALIDDAQLPFPKRPPVTIISYGLCFDTTHAYI